MIMGTGVRVMIALALRIISPLPLEESTALEKKNKEDGGAGGNSTSMSWAVEQTYDEDVTDPSVAHSDIQGTSS